jgi:hypothetical protein
LQPRRHRQLLCGPGLWDDKRQHRKSACEKKTAPPDKHNDDARASSGGVTTQPLDTAASPGSQPRSRPLHSGQPRLWPRARSRRTGGRSRRRRPSSRGQRPPTVFWTRARAKKLVLVHISFRGDSTISHSRSRVRKVCRPFFPPPSATRRRQALSSRWCPGARSRAGRGRGGERQRRGPRVCAHRYTKKP